MNILNERRKSRGYVASEPITTFIALNATAIATSAVIGAVGAAVSGGNILKGALFGAITGGVMAGVSNVIAGGEFLGGAVDSATAAVGAENAAAIESAATEAAIGGASSASENIVDLSEFSGADGLAPSDVASPNNTPTAPAQTAQNTSAVDQPATGANSSGGIDLTGKDTSLSKPTSEGLLGSVKNAAGKLASGILDDKKLGSTGLLVAGNMLSGYSQSKAAQQRYDQQLRNGTWQPIVTRGV